MLEILLLVFARELLRDWTDSFYQDYGNKLVVRLLQLDIISKAENPNCDSYHAGRFNIDCQRLLLAKHVLTALNVVSVMIHLTEQNLSM
jgi:hypothetical protein